MIDFNTIALARSIPIDRVIDGRGIKLKGRTDRSGPCPRCGGDDRFAINVKKQVWNCRGCNMGGDVIELVRFLDGVGFCEAVEQLTGERLSNGSDKSQIDAAWQPSATGYERQQLDKARYFFRSSKPSMGTPVEKYMLARGIASPLPSTVRFLPPLRSEHHPAMLVPYGLPHEPEPGVLEIAENEITAIQLTLLKPDGSGKADIKPNKITIASTAGLPMVLAPVNDVMGLAIAEGCEDALSVHCATGLGAWASGGRTLMPKLANAVPDYVEAVTICAHDDGRQQVLELADALGARGIDVFIEGNSL
jgi:putative DNA primase/helicase